MRRMVVLAALAALGSSPALAAGEAKEFKAKNFKWTLPSDEWHFKDATAEQQQSGYVVTAECGEDGGIRADVRVVPSEGISARAIADEVRENMGLDFKKTTQATITTGRLSGLDGSLVVMQGTAQNGTAMWFRGYAAVEGKTLHQLLITAFNGAEAKRGKQIDELRRGYRLLEGAGPEEEEVGSAGGKDATKPLDGAAPGGWPAKGPKVEGNKVVFPNQNVAWTLPEGSPFSWRNPVEDEKSFKEGLLIAAVASLPRKDKPADEPKTNDCTIRFIGGPLRPGASEDVLVNASNVQESVIKQVFGGKIDASKTKVSGTVDVGNVQGARFQMAGGEGKKVHWFIFQTVMLKDWQYEWHIDMQGGKEIQSEFGPALGALFKGLEFLDTKEAVRGPVSVEAVLAHFKERGKNSEKEIEQAVPGGITAKKPKGFSQLEFEGGRDPALRLAWETRAADGMSYVYFDVHSYDAAEMQKESKDLADIVKERETTWKTGTGDDAVTVTKGKDPYYDAAWSGEKGVGYRFTGSAGGHPFVEQGWVGKIKGNVIWVRIQHGGANAEKTLESQTKALRKALKFN